MAKITLDEKIMKVQEAIRKEEAVIAQSRDKLKSLQADLKALERKKEQSFAAEIISTVSDGATLTNAQRSELLSLLKSFKLSAAPESETGSGSDQAAVSQKAASETETQNSESGSAFS